MRNTFKMAVSVVALVGVGMVAGSFVAPAYSDGVSKQRAGSLQPYVENTDTVQYGKDSEDAGHDTAAHEQPLATGVTQVTEYRMIDANAPGPVVVTSAQESIDVQARRLPNGTQVAVRGDVVRASGKMLIIDRPDGRVQVTLPGAIPAIMSGDDVTVFGRIANRSDNIAVRAEAVLQHMPADAMTLQEKAHLHMAPSNLQTVNKFNKSVTNGQARSALERFRATYLEL